ncbi:MAG: hypothetical protein FD166_2436 [Bacteroidetes bacterium]|nr:MAG: hypothetical protein FD166_2436 [Bacteroidota bacterium]
MNLRKKLWSFLAFDSVGWVATAALILCAVSGLLLTIPYDASNPYLSVTRLVTANPAASFARNIHYWSAQLFLILTLFHVFDHLLKNSEKNLRSAGVWLRLSASLAFVFYVMISGFILKGDGDGLQAQRILNSLLSSIPLAGQMLADTFVGPSGKFLLLYIHHAATATIIIFIVVYEHVRSLAVNIRTFVITALFLGFLSFFLRAPLQGMNEEMMKGPWYFAGIQEILHWLSETAYVAYGMLILLLLFCLIFYMKLKPKRITLKLLISFTVIYGVLTISGLFFRGAYWQWQWPWQAESRISELLVPDHISLFRGDNREIISINGRVEGCLSCHVGMTGFSDAHNPRNIGCYSCHGGDPLTLDKSLAHRGMFRVPGNLSNAGSACGGSGCHTGIAERLPRSLMATLSGMISVDRWVFGENELPEGHATVGDIGSKTPSDVHLRNLCAGCHLGNEKRNPGPPDWLDRGGGCNACHLKYDAKALSTLIKLKKGIAENDSPAFHPAIGLAITNDHCKSCHSRSGRISMNYEGWHETNLKTSDLKGRNDLMVLPDKRVFIKQPEDVHHKAGMLCTDCHGSFELMGDGNRYMHKEEAVKVQCTDCHAIKVIRTAKIGDTDQETRLIAWLRGYNNPDAEIILTQKVGHALINTRVEQKGKILKLIRKSGTGSGLMNPPAEACTRGIAHNRLSCDACHTGWAPQCIGCHTEFNTKENGYDMLTGKRRNGSWVEYAAEGLAELPVLGVNETDKSVRGGKITTFIPGMIMTLDKESYRKGSGKTFHRLYAPASAHTTQRTGRSCKSCHNDPLALGYGRGSLTLTAGGNWVFDPEYKTNKEDGLPEDAWTGFLKERKGLASTRMGMRPFSISEQKKILTAGACLTCHKENSDVMKKALSDFNGEIRLRKKTCILPVW